MASSTILHLSCLIIIVASLACSLDSKGYAGAACAFPLFKFSVLAGQWSVILEPESAVDA